MQAYSYTTSGKYVCLYSVCDYLFSLYAFRSHYLHDILLSFQVISAFLIVTIVFIPIGVASLIASRDVRL